MAARGDERQERRRGGRRRQMTREVMNGHERHVEAPGKCLAVAEPDEQRSDEPRPAGGGDGVEVAKLESGRCQGVFDGGVDYIEVLAAGPLRHYATELGVQRRLAPHDVR